MGKLRKRATATQEAGRSQTNSISDDLFKRQMPFTPAFTNRWQLLQDTPLDCLEVVNDVFEIQFDMLYGLHLCGDIIFEDLLDKGIIVQFTKLRYIGVSTGYRETGVHVRYNHIYTSADGEDISRVHRFGAPAEYSYDENGIYRLEWKFDGRRFSTGAFWHYMAELWGDVLYRCTGREIASKYKSQKRYRMYFNPSTKHNFIPCPKYITITKRKNRTCYETVWYWQGKRVSMKKYWYEVERFFDVVLWGKKRMIITN